MKVVYIASPYTIGNQAENVRYQIDIAEELMALGYCPLAPLLNHFHHLVYPHTHSEWLMQCLSLLSKCDCVLRLHGESIGADREVAHAEELGIPVFHSIAKLSYHYLLENKKKEEPTPDSLSLIEVTPNRCIGCGADPSNRWTVDPGDKRTKEEYDEICKKCKERKELEQRFWRA